MQNHARFLSRLLILLVAVVLLGGCADFKKTDPWEPTNRFFHNFNNSLDKYALKPVSDVYVKYVPKAIQNGLANGFDNLEYFDVILSDYLEGNWQQGLSDSGRMLVNSTVGIAGIFDVATYWHMPKHENDFGVVLGKWGLEPGPYMELPFFGPYSVRDSPDIVVGIFTNPLTYVHMPIGAVIGLEATQAIVNRVRLEGLVRFRNYAAIDDYVFTRDAYLQYRRNLVGGGQLPGENIYDEDTEPATQPATQSATQPATQAATLPETAPAPKVIGPYQKTPPIP